MAHDDNEPAVPRPLQQMAESFDDSDREYIARKLPGKLEQLERAHRDVGYINRLLRRARLFFDLLFDKSFKTSWKVYAVTGGALLYFLNPLDVIPDVIIGIGWLDDAYVLGWVMKIYNDEIERYIAFRGLSDREYR